MQCLFKKIPFIGCINLKKNTQRYENTQREFSRIGILDMVTYFRPDPHPRGGRYGCYDSHLTLYRQALEQNAAYALIFEDDFVFVDEHVERAMMLAMYCMEIRPDWDVIKMSKNMFLCFHEIVYMKNKNDIILSASVFHTPCYFVSRAFMQMCVARGVTDKHIDKDHVDDTLSYDGLTPTCSMYWVLPYMTRTIDAGSDINWNDGKEKKLKCNVVYGYASIVRHIMNYMDISPFNFYTQMNMPTYVRNAFNRFMQSFADC